MIDTPAMPVTEEKIEQAATRSIPVYLCVLLLLGAVVSTSIGRSFTAMTQKRDSYLFAYIGAEWLQGRIPYLHIWDNKPPGIYAINALVFSVFPNSFAALAVMEGVFILGCVITIYFLLRRWGAGPEAAIFAAAAACVSCNLYELNDLGNYTEIYLLWPAVLSMYWFTREGRQFPSGGMFLAGVFAGIASLFKPVGLAPALAQTTFLFFLVISRRVRLRPACRALIVGFAGVIFAWVPFCLYFWKHGALREMIDAALIYPLFYGAAGQTHLLSEPFVLASRLLPVGSLVTCALAGLPCFVVSLVKDEPPSQRSSPVRFYWPLVIMWVLFDLAGALAGGQNWAHYFLCMAPSLSVAAAVAVWSMFESGPLGTFPAVNRNLAFALVLGPLLLSQARDVLRIRNFYCQDGYIEGWVAEGTPDTIPPQVQAFANEFKDVAGYLNRVRRPGDTLFSWLFLPNLYYETGMRAPTRPISAGPLVWFQRSHDQFGAEILRDLEKSPPTFIVDVIADPAEPAKEDWVYREFHELVQRSYEVAYTTHDRERELVVRGEVRVYSRIQPPTQ